MLRVEPPSFFSNETRVELNFQPDVTSLFVPWFWHKKSARALELAAKALGTYRRFLPAILEDQHVQFGLRQFVGGIGEFLLALWSRWVIISINNDAMMYVGPISKYFYRSVREWSKYFSLLLLNSVTTASIAAPIFLFCLCQGQIVGVVLSLFCHCNLNHDDILCTCNRPCHGFGSHLDR